MAVSASDCRNGRRDTRIWPRAARVRRARFGTGIVSRVRGAGWRSRGNGRRRQVRRLALQFDAIYRGGVLVWHMLGMPESDYPIVKARLKCWLIAGRSSAAKPACQFLIERKPDGPSGPWLSHRGSFATGGSKPHRVRHRRAALCDPSDSLDNRRSSARWRGKGAPAEIPVSPLGIGTLSLRGGSKGEQR